MVQKVVDYVVYTVLGQSVRFTYNFGWCVDSLGRCSQKKLVPELIGSPNPSVSQEFPKAGAAPAGSEKGGENCLSRLVKTLYTFDDFYSSIVSIIQHPRFP